MALHLITLAAAEAHSEGTSANPYVVGAVVLALLLALLLATIVIGGGREHS